MKYNITVQKTPELNGIIKAPPSKSYTHRAVIVASLDGNSNIVNPLYADDTIATIYSLRKLGAVIKKEKGFLKITGCNGIISPVSRNINVGEAGTLLRFILPIVSLAKGNFTIDGKGTLLNRSNAEIAEALMSWGVGIEAGDGEYKLPLKIKSKGQIKGGEVFVTGSTGSQAVSSLLIVSNFAKSDVTIILKDELASRPYVDITIDVLAQAGVNVVNDNYKRFFVKCGQGLKMPNEFVINGDYSSASFLLAAAALIPSDITVTNLKDDKQGDKKIIGILNDMGAKIEHIGDAVKIKGPFELKGIDIDCSDTPDLVPILTTMAMFAKGRTRIYNIKHLANKESNRITMPASQLIKLGAKISTTKDTITIEESILSPQEVSSCGDHRIAMSLVVAGLRIGKLKIKDIDAISKSYPDFLKDIKSLGGRIIS